MTAREKYGFKLYNVNTLRKPDGREELPFASLVTYDGVKAFNLEELSQMRTNGLCMDSGAFPAFKANKDLDLNKYIQYVLKVQDKLDWFAQLDFIPRLQGGKTEDLQREAADKTWERYKIMHEAEGMDISKLCFVVHGQSNVEPNLRRALSWCSPKTGRGVEMVACGLAFNDNFLRLKQLSIIQEIFKEFNFTGRFHALGVQDKDLFVKFPFITSCDSSSAIRDTISGHIFIDGKTHKVLDDEKLSHKSKLSPKMRELQLQYLKSNCEANGCNWEVARKQDGYFERYVWSCIERTKWFTPKQYLK